METGKVSVNIHEGIGSICFEHPKSNSLPISLVNQITDKICELGDNKDVHVIVLRSEGEKIFCAGASFDELISIKNLKAGKEFFMVFAKLILAMKNCPKFIIARIHGKAVGGGVGIAAASDYTLALNEASVKLGELELGLGPFVIGPAVERKIGKTAFITMTVDADWHDAFWAKQNGLFTKVFANKHDMDEAISRLAKKLSLCNPEAIAEMKRVFWEGTEDWPELLAQRAEISGKLVLSEFTKNYLKKFKNKE